MKTFTSSVILSGLDPEAACDVRLKSQIPSHLITHTQKPKQTKWPPCQHSLLLVVLDELLGLVVLLLQGLVLGLGLLQVLVDCVAEGLRLDPVALQLHHPLLVLLDAGLQLALLLLPALLLPLHRRQLG